MSNMFINYISSSLNSGTNMDKIMEDVIEKIEKILKQKGWNKTEFAKRLNKTPGWVNNKLKQHRELSTKDVILITKTLDISMASLFTPKEAPDLETMSFRELMRTMIHEEIEKYCNKYKEDCNHHKKQ